ncbi:MAG: WecB/TagA/CpsF family glycosyltransferase [Cyanobacteria bacterium J069]|nr:MAG: glycosyltransferase [Cyanobacteria bacterium J069]
MKLRSGYDVLKETNILGISINNFSKQEFLETLVSGVVFTPNVDHLIKLERDLDFFRVYQDADYRVCDSKILFYVSRFLGMPIKEKISGSELLPDFCHHHRHNESVKVFLLGAREGVAYKAQQRINAKVGRDIVVGAYSPSFGFEQDELECAEIVEMINRSGATVLAVGVGAPKQEKWIAKYKHQLPNVRIFLAIGAAIDFEAGQKRRSPRWISEAGLEWLHRLISEPRRLWRRYLVDAFPFFWLVLKQKLNLYHSPHLAVLSQEAYSPQEKVVQKVGR